MYILSSEVRRVRQRTGEFDVATGAQKSRSPAVGAAQARVDATGRLKRWVGRLVALGLGLGIALGSIEVLLRARPPMNLDRLRPYSLDGTPNTRQTTFEHVDNPRMGYWLRAGSEGRIVYPQPDGSQAREIVYAVNADGFRDTPRSQERPPGTYRIAMLGDSFVYGNGVQQHETLPFALERALNQGSSGTTFEVMNCGVYAYNSRQAVELLKTRVLPFQPNAVVLTFFLNDVFHADLWNTEVLDGWEAAAISRLGLELDPNSAEDVPRGWLQHSAMFARRHLVSGRVVSRWLFRRLDAAAYERRIRALYEPDSPGWMQVVGAFDEARRLARHHGFELRVVIYPYVEHVDNYPWRPYHAQVEELCAKLGIVCHDLLPAIERHKAANLIVHPLDTHGNAACNELLGTYLAAELRRSATGSR